jgi:hypothetical protein
MDDFAQGEDGFMLADVSLAARDAEDRGEPVDVCDAPWG